MRQPHSGLADRSPSFVTFLTVCQKYGYSIVYVFHEIASSSPRWKDILSQTQIFCVFPSAMETVLSYLVKFVARSASSTYITRQQLWITNLVKIFSKKQVIPAVVLIGGNIYSGQCDTALRWKTLLSSGAK